MKYRVKIGCYYEHKGISHPENTELEIDGKADLSRLDPVEEPKKETKKAAKVGQEEES